MYKGKVLRVTCQDLGLHEIDWTKEGSYKAARNWFDARIAELTKPSPEDELRTRYLRQDLAETKRKAAAYEAIIAEHVSEQMGDLFPPELREEITQEAIDAAAFLDQGGAVESDKTIAAVVARFLDAKLTDRLKPKSMEAIHRVFSMLRKCPAWKPEVGIEDLGANEIEGIFGWVKNQSGLALPTQSRIVSTIRGLFNFAHETEIIDRLPRNLKSKRHFIKSGNGKDKKIYTTEQVYEVLLRTEPYPKLRLYALLAVNCGFYGSDIGTLEWSEWKDGRITTSRRKTEDRGGLKVSWLLWPETEELLRQFSSRHPQYVLASRSNTPLYRDFFSEEGKPIVSDLVATKWVAKRFGLPLAAFRHYGANEIRREFGKDVADTYLAHAPQSVGAKHYYDDRDPKLDEALLWLRSQLFI
jgi:integrase